MHGNSLLRTLCNKDNPLPVIVHIGINSEFLRLDRSLDLRIGEQKMSNKRNADAIAAEIKASREHLAKTVADLNGYVKPMNMVSQGMGLGNSFFINEKGNLRIERIVAVAAVGLALVGLFSRSRKD